MKECNLKRRQFLKSVALSAATIGLSHQPFAARAEAAALNTEYLQKNTPSAAGKHRCIRADLTHRHRPDPGSGV